MFWELRFLLLTSLMLLGCSYSIDKNPAPTIPSPSNYQPSQLTFSSISSQVLRPSCIACHGNSGGISLENYDSVKLNLAKIQTAVFTARSMPKSPTAELTTYQLGLLNAWLLAGAPENAPGEPTEPPPNPLEPTFDSIKLNILVPKCLQCHSPGKPVARIPLVTKEDILNSPLDLAIPGNASESGLYLAITNEDQKKLMPPLKDSSGNSTGFTKLSEPEIQAIFEWIQRGAQ